MKYLSVCSGIEAATVAWHSLGWKAAAYSEIEPFPSAVLAHHYPDVPNVGDMTKFKEWNIEPGSIDLLVGGTPCQSFSVAGLRKGLDDPRGNLMLTYLAIARQYRPRWLVWENVPGVLSSNRGLDFASLLRGMGECGYGFAYRVLDAQYFGVPQRRRRVFVVGYLGDWRAAAAVLFERHSLSGHPAPSREKRQAVAGTIEASLGRSRGAGTPTSAICPTLRAGGNRTGGDRPPGTDVDTADSLIVQPYPIANTLTARMHKGLNSTLDEGQTPVMQTANIYGGNKRQDRPDGGFYVRMNEDTSKTLDAASGLNPICSQGGTAVMQPIALAENTIGRQPHNGGNGDGFTDGGPMYTLNATGVHGVAQPIATHDVAGTMVSRNTSGGFSNSIDHAAAGYMAMHSMQVRRLTPVECERLQGFPDDYTAIPWRKKPADQCPDGPRYKALGNSMAVPVMAWIGKRIQEFEAGNAS